jgi:hypothetical protein
MGFQQLGNFPCRVPTGRVLLERESHERTAHRVDADGVGEPTLEVFAR